MAALKNLKERLDGAQQDLDELIADFEKVVALRHSLNAADASLKKSSDTVADMASALKDESLGLKECITSLKTAAEIMAGIDPQEINRSFAKFDARVARLEESAARIDKGIGASATRESLALVLVVLLLVVSSLHFFFAYGPSEVTRDFVPSSQFALRGTLHDGVPALVAPEVIQTEDVRVAMLCAASASEAGACEIVTAERRGYGTRRKGEST